MNKFITMLIKNTYNQNQCYYGDIYLRDYSWQYVVLYMIQQTDEYIKEYDLIYEDHLKDTETDHLEKENLFNYKLYKLKAKYEIHTRTALREWLKDNEIEESDVIEFYLSLNNDHSIENITPSVRKRLFVDIDKYKNGKTIEDEIHSLHTIK